MDDALDKIINSLTASNPDQDVEIRLDPANDSIRLHGPDGTITHRLKPLAELFGTGVNAETFDPASDEYAPLCIAIEERFAESGEILPQLRDSQVASALNRLAISPEAPPAGDGLVEAVQFHLRILLSLKDYSRRDVQRACRRIARSVDHHTREDGPRGYVTFIRQALRN
jgi:hypothetical protein